MQQESALQEIRAKFGADVITLFDEMYQREPSLFMAALSGVMDDCRNLSADIKKKNRAETKNRLLEQLHKLEKDQPQAWITSEAMNLFMFLAHHQRQQETTGWINSWAGMTKYSCSHATETFQKLVTRQVNNMCCSFVQILFVFWPIFVRSNHWALGIFTYADKTKGKLRI